MRAADTINDAFDCVVPIIHHCPHGADRPRGHSSLLGVADVLIAVKRDDANNVVSTVELAKDGATGLQVVSQLRRGRGRQGRRRRDADVACRRPRWRPGHRRAQAGHPSRHRREVEFDTVKIEMLRAYDRLADSVEATPGLNGKPVRKVSVDKLRDELRSSGLFGSERTGALTNTGRSHFRRAKASLADRRHPDRAEGADMEVKNRFLLLVFYTSLHVQALEERGLFFPVSIRPNRRALRPLHCNALKESRMQRNVDGQGPLQMQRRENKAATACNGLATETTVALCCNGVQRGGKQKSVYGSGDVVGKASLGTARQISKPASNCMASDFTKAIRAIVMRDYVPSSRLRLMRPGCLSDLFNVHSVKCDLGAIVSVDTYLAPYFSHSRSGPACKLFFDVTSGGRPKNPSSELSPISQLENITL